MKALGISRFETYGHELRVPPEGHELWYSVYDPETNFRVTYTITRRALRVWTAIIAAVIVLRWLL